MKKAFYTVLVMVSLLGCSNSSIDQQDTKLFHELMQLSDQLNFFKLRQIYSQQGNTLSPPHRLYTEAVINNVFNKPELSHQAIQTLLNGDTSQFNDTLLKDLCFLEIQNQTNLYNYKAALQASEYLLDHYTSLIDSSELTSTQNAHQVWRALKDVPMQEVTRNDNTNISLERDKMGLLQLKTSFSDSSMNFIFDTGANFSTIRKSLVAKLGLQPIEADFSVTSSTGARVKTELAIARCLNIGGLTFKNVVFLVMPDQKLSFPQVDYNIQGIIGFPVIKAMEEIHITRNNRLIVPRDISKDTLNNLALDCFMPIIAVQYKGDTIRMGFDTGAAKTTLYSLFYQQYKQDIDHKYTKETFKASGAGGTNNFEGYTINNFNLKIANSKARLDSVKLHIDDIGIGKDLHGNFGQDYIKKFDQMIINFKNSSVKFK